MAVKKKKILFIVGGSYISGAEIVSLDVIKGLKNDYEIHCAISGWNDGDFKSRLEKENITYTEIKLGWYYLTKLMWSLDSLIHYPKAFLDYFKLLKKFNPDIIYVISYRYLILLYPLINKKVIYHVHDTNSHSKQHKFFLNLIDKKVTKYIAVSHFIRKDLMLCGLSDNKITVVHNGVEIPDESKIIKTKSDVLRIGIVGQIIPRKGHNLLLKAFDILNRKGYKFICNIYGKGDDNFIKELKKEADNLGIADLIVWKGFEKDKYEIYSNIDLLIAPTITDEPFGMIAIEAQSYGIPVIASAAGGFKENIIEDETGFLFNNNDVGELSMKIEELYINNELLLKFSTASKKNVEMNFTISKMIFKIKKLLLEIFYE